MGDRRCTHCGMPSDRRWTDADCSDTAQRVLDAAGPLIAARVRAAVAEEIALHLLSRRPHIPPSTHPDRKVAVAMRDTLNRSARWARQHATPPAEEDTDDT